MIVIAIASPIASATVVDVVGRDSKGTLPYRPTRLEQHEISAQGRVRVPNY
jgi:hypothetical protein